MTNLYSVIGKVLHIGGFVYDCLFGRFRLDLTYLSIIAAVEATILAILIPVSIEVVSRVRDKYDSEAIMELYESDEASKYLPLLLVTNVILAVYSAFALQWSAIPNIAGSLLSTTEFLILVCTLILVLRLFRLMQRIIGHPEWILQEFAKRAKEQFEERV